MHCELFDSTSLCKIGEVTSVNLFYHMTLRLGVI